MGRLVYNPKLIQKIAEKLHTVPLKVIKSVSNLAGRKGISPEVALLLYARKHDIRTAVYQKKLSPDKQLEFRSLIDTPANSVKLPVSGPSRKPKKIPSTPTISEIDYSDPFLGPNALSKESTEAYQILYLLENSIRAFVVRVLENKFGKDWWHEIGKTKSTTRIATKVSERLKTERDNWDHTKRGIHEIYYTDFEHLLCIIRCFDAEFGPHFKKGHAQNMIGNISALVQTRNVTAHNNAITKDDLDKLKVYAKEWFKYMRSKYSDPK